ncbi:MULTISPECIES: site-specific integrase [Burkholderia]|uniref:Tyrosine recombinase XerD n=1 Tax=Burkholderia aenigmatica TaxID=2015348 RepID=A0A6J5IRZ3_9BURK|nr:MULTISPECIES: site-specific integrase [Burkholderia]CAB3963146.1 Tyrosine recombinase XerD [Burkholderia aenigmatica]
MAAVDPLSSSFVYVKEPPRIVTIASEGVPLELLSGGGKPVLSVTDSSGAIVVTAHLWLRSLVAVAGVSLAMSTVELYGRIVSYLCRWIETKGPFPHLTVDENILRLNRQNLTAWLKDMSDSQGLEHTTMHNREACIRTFLEWLATKDAGNLRDQENSPYGRDGNLRYITASPAPRSPKFIAAEHLIAALNGMHNECERCMFHTQFDTGLRISEVTGMSVSDLPDPAMYNPAFEFLPLSVRRAKGRGGQTTEKSTLISRAVLNRIKRYHSSPEYKLAPNWDIRDPRKPVFLTVNQLRWSNRNASKQFKAAVRRGDANDAMSTHWMRHGTAYSVLRSDIGKTYEERMLIAQQMLGHASLATTEIYTQIPPALLMKLTKKGQEMNRLHEAEHIRKETFLGPLQHREKRGHHV